MSILKEFGDIQDSVLKREWGPLAGTPTDDFDSKETASTGITPATNKLIIPNVTFPANPGWRPLYQVGSYFCTPAEDAVSGSITVGSEWTIPFQVMQTINCDQIAIDVSALSLTAVTRLGIYKNVDLTNNPPKTYYPGAVLLDAGTVDVTATGIRSIAISQTMTPGIYWFVLKTTTASAAMRLYNSAATIGNPLLGLGFDGGTTTFTRTFLGFRRTGLAAGAFSDPYPAGATLTSSTNMPIVAVRILSLP
jgi:hypothetical protein